MALPAVAARRRTARNSTQRAKGSPPLAGAASLVDESQDPWIVTDTSCVEPPRAIVMVTVSPAL